MIELENEKCNRVRMYIYRYITDLESLKKSLECSYLRNYIYTIDEQIKNLNNMVPLINIYNVNKKCDILETLFLEESRKIDDIKEDIFKLYSLPEIKKTCAILSTKKSRKFRKKKTVKSIKKSKRKSL